MVHFSTKTAIIVSALVVASCASLLTLNAAVGQTSKQLQAAPRVPASSHSQAVKLFDNVLQGPPTAEPSVNSHPTRLIVRFKPTATAAIVNKSHLSAMGAQVLRNSTAVPGLTIVQVAATDRAAALAAYRIDPSVLYAEIDHVIKISATPDDTRFTEQWGLLNTGQTIAGQVGTAGADIRATQAWGFWTGDPDFRIAVNDTGIDLTHPDLAANIWTNPGEIPNNGVDDDLNGWIDDVHGYDFFDDDSDPTDENGHGTHVSGTIGAVGNNGIGVAGVNWQCKLVALRIFGADGSGFTSDAVEAFDYIIANNLTISNNSWETTQFSQALEDVISASQAIDHLVIAAAGNSLGRDIDVIPSYPAAFDLPNIIAVAGTTNDDVVLFLSNIGPKSVDLGAPGEAILSTELGGMYGYKSGTSMSTAFVTGTAALLRSRLPALSSDQIVARLLGTARPIDALLGRILTGGVVNAVAAAADCNGNGILDELDIQAGTSTDCDSNSLPDDCQSDCNINNTADSCDIADGISLDCNGNGVPDECDISAGTSKDCNTNGVPDGCDLASGLSSDLNMSQVPDECETCTLDSECQDSNPCTDDVCDNGLCQNAPNISSCDDGEVCTENDVCSGGVCSGTVMPTIACAPQLNVVAAAINGVRFPGGPLDTTTILRGDQITIEIFAQGWSPREIRGYGLSIKKDALRSGSTGALQISNAADLSQSAFIDENRGDYMFASLTTFASVSDSSDGLRFSYLNALIFPDDCPNDTGTPKYLGSLIVSASDTASGTFVICLDDENIGRSTLIDCASSNSITPIQLTCLTIDVPSSGCDMGPDCDGNGIWDICDIFNGESDCNRNDIPDVCELFDGAVEDCNSNNIPDSCDVASAFSEDCTNNGIPDECEVDCNGNGQADICDIFDGSSLDCNTNGTPDECDVFYVSAAASGANDGTSWFNAFNSLSSALSEALLTCGGAQIWVAAGTYTPAQTGLGRIDSFRLIRGVSILGGFTGVESTADQRNPVANPTILSGDQNGDDSVDPATKADNNYHVINGSNTASDAILDGFIIVGGYADGSGRRSDGGGLFLDRGSPRIENCQFIGNYAARDGGAVFTVKRNPQFFNCIFNGNKAARDGGAFFHLGGNIQLSNCTIIHNNAGQRVGGVASFGFQDTALANVNIPGRVDLINTILWDNTENENPTPSFRTQIEAESPRAFYSNILGLIGQLNGNNNFSSDPMFVDADGVDNIIGTTDDNLRLMNGSASIDAGFSSLPFISTNDLELGDRVQNCRADVGAFESLFFADCNANNLPDGCEAADGLIADCNMNLVPDECEPDCNGNGIADQCDIDSGISQDCNSNTLPDECEPDCNNNGRADDCDVNFLFSPDCNQNLIPDECDLSAAISLDCDSNFVPDECDALSDFTFVSDTLGPFDRDTPLQFIFDAPPAQSDVTLSFLARGDLASPSEYLTIFLNGVSIGRIFELGVRECSNGQDFARIVLTADEFNALVPDFTVVIDAVSSDQIDPNACAISSTLSVRANLFFSGINDCDANIVPDICQFDRDFDGVIDVCDDCPNDPTETVATLCGCGIPEIDSDGDTVPDCLDRCPSIDDLADLDGNGTADCAEAIPTVSDWGIAILTLLLLIAAKIASCKLRCMRFTFGQPS